MRKMFCLLLSLTICICFTACQIDSNQSSILGDSVSESSKSVSIENLERFNFDYFISDSDMELLKKSYNLTFLNDKLQEKFVEARFLAYQFVMFSSVCPLGNNPIKIKNEHITNEMPEEYLYYTSYKMSFNSFDNAVKATFSDDYIKKNIKDKKRYINLKGKLACQSGDGGNDMSFNDIKFNLISENENKIVFNGIADYSNGENGDKLEKWTKEYTYTILKTENGWRFDTFPLWD